MVLEKEVLVTDTIVSENRVDLEKNFLDVFIVVNFIKMVPVALAIMAIIAHRTMRI